jgi:spermidine synthase
VILFLLTIGFVSMLGQVVILRELLVAFYGIELVYTAAIGIWLFWSGAGVFLFKKIRPTLNVVVLIFFALALVFPLDVLFIRSGRILFSAIPGTYLSFREQGLILLLSLCPIGIVLGLLFQWVARLWAGADRSLAAAYTVESLGGLLGGLAATLFFHWGFQNLTLTLLCSLACLLGPLFHARLSPTLRWTGTLFSFSLLALFFWVGPLDRSIASWNHPGLIALSDTPYGRMTVAKISDQISVYDNDVLIFESQGRDVESFSHLAALQHPGLSGKRVLVLGGLDGTVQELNKYHPGRLDWVELNQPGTELMLSLLPQEITRPLFKAPVNRHFGDPRLFLKKTGPYDLIVLAVEEPVSGQANRFYTREFFVLCGRRLTPNGILALRLGSGENLWTPAMQSRLAGIDQALRMVFPEVLILPGETNVLTASFRPLPKNADPLIERWQNLNLGTKLVSPPFIRYLFSNDRFFTVQETLRTLPAPPNSDLRPLCYRHTLTIWLSKFFPSLAAKSWLNESKGISMPILMGLIGLILVVFIGFRLWGGSLHRVMLAGIAGFLGMMFESVLILYYQVKVGVLYQDIGILLTSFMAGLAIGAQATEKGLIGKGDLRRRIRYWGLILLFGFVLIAGTVTLMMQRDYEIGLAETILLLAASGFIVAGVFVCAGRSGNISQEEAVAPVYGADLWGGCLGALSAGIILVPLWGLPEAVYLTLLISALSIVLI